MGDIMFDLTPVFLFDCDWNQYVDYEGECEECDATCTSGCTNGDVCFECHPTCRTCTGHSSDECVDCWCGAELDADGCCVCNGDAGFEAEGDKCQQTGCFGEGCTGCYKDQCIHCDYGYDLHEGHCFPCKEEDCDDLYSDLPLCQEKGIRHDTGICNCDQGWGGRLDGEVDDNMCRLCSMGCETCFIDAAGRPNCEWCAEGYYLVADMPHLCAFLQNEESVPMGYSIIDGSLVTGDFYLDLFGFDLTKSPQFLEDFPYAGAWVN